MRDGLVGHVIEAALGVGIVEIDGGRQLLVHQRQHGDAGFKSAGAAEQVPGHRFGAADLELVAERVLAKDRFNGARFVAVAGRSGCGVGVDVAHFFRLNAGVFQRGPHAALRACAVGRDAGHVIGVGAHAVADHLGQNLCAARFGKLQLFENQNARALADDKAVAILVEWAAGVGRLVVARGKRAHGGESAHGHGRDRGLGAAGNHRVGVAVQNHAHRVADGVGAGGAGRGRGRDGAPRAVADADLPGGHVHNGRGNEKRRHLARAALQQVVVLALDHLRIRRCPSR